MEWALVQVFDEGAPLSVAHEKCRAMGGHLIRIQSEPEQKFMVELARKGRTSVYWIDGSDVRKEGTWLFSDGSAMSFFAWTKGEPNNSRGISHWIFCARTLGFQWNDSVSGLRDRGYICEWD